MVSTLNLISNGTKESSLGKTTRGQKEYSKEQELKYENKELRNRIRELEHEIRMLTRQTARTRKQFARMDLDRHAYVRDIIQEHYANEVVEQNTQDMLLSLKNTWKCRECSSGHLEIFLYTRQDGTYYYRICSNAPECSNRTKAQKYNDNVKGVIRSVDQVPDKNDRLKKK